MKGITMDIRVGDLFEIGIGFGEIAKVTVVKIDRDSVNGDMAVLEMVDFGGPLLRKSLKSLRDLK